MSFCSYIKQYWTFVDCCWTVLNMAFSRTTIKIINMKLFFKPTDKL